MEFLDYEAARFWMSAVQILALVALFAYTHITNKSKANTSAIGRLRAQTEEYYDHLEERVVRAERRQDVFESKLADAPGHNELSKVYDRLNEVAEDLSRTSGQMQAVSHQLSMVNSYLLNSKGDQPK